MAIFLTTSVFAEEPVTPAVPDQNEARETLYFGENLKLAPKTEQEDSKEKYYTIKVNYPQIEGDNLSANEKQFNQVVSDLANQEIVQFKKYVAADMVHMQTLPDELKHNSFQMDYDIDVVKSKSGSIISVRLSNEGFQAGRAHPYHNHRVINFDLGTGKVITLDSLFKPRSKYLSIIANYSKTKLDEKLKDKSFIANGTKAEAKNFKNWNVENDAILITFDEYQVAPYVYGAQEVEIPYEVLKSVISPKAVIYPCVKDSASCSLEKSK